MDLKSLIRYIAYNYEVNPERKEKLLIILISLLDNRDNEKKGNHGKVSHEHR